MEQVKNNQWWLPKSKLVPRAREERAILMLCIGIALVFWIGVKMSQEYVSTKKIELHFIIPPNQAFRKAPPINMNIQLKGSGWNMFYDYLLNSRIHLTYDLSERNSIRLDEKRLLKDIRNRLSADKLTFFNLSHSDFKLSLEPSMDKWVPIRPITDLGYQPGHYLSGNIEFEPDTVQISGPESVVQPIYEWPTEILILKDLKNGYEGELKLKATSPELQLFPNAVNIKVPVEQVTEKSLFVKIQVKNATQQYRLFPSQVRLICNVGLSQFNALTSADFEAEVDLSNASQQIGNTVPITINRQPTIVTSVRFEPKVVEFYVVKKEIN
jgi:hypothetical protein